MWRNELCTIFTVQWAKFNSAYLRETEEQIMMFPAISGGVELLQEMQEMRKCWSLYSQLSSWVCSCAIVIWSKVIDVQKPGWMMTEIWGRTVGSWPWEMVKIEIKTWRSAGCHSTLVHDGTGRLLCPSPLFCLFSSSWTWPHQRTSCSTSLPVRDEVNLNSN